MHNSNTLTCNTQITDCQLTYMKRNKISSFMH